MTETVVKTFEELKKSGKALAEVEPKALSELLRKHADDA